MSRRSPWPVVGVGAVVWKDDGLLLIKRGKPPMEGSWSLPGGHQEPGETVAAAVEREIREETGVAIRIVGLAGVVDLIAREGKDLLYHYTVIDLVAEWVAGEAKAASDAEAVAWVKPDALEPYALSAQVRQIIALAEDKRRSAAA
jgi:ADP-ribose pyrophosphatase YjhB (NUDIX family)